MFLLSQWRLGNNKLIEDLFSFECLSIHSHWRPVVPGIFVGAMIRLIRCVGSAWWRNSMPGMKKKELLLLCINPEGGCGGGRL